MLVKAPLFDTCAILEKTVTRAFFTACVSILTSSSRGGSLLAISPFSSDFQGCHYIRSGRTFKTSYVLVHLR